MNVKDTTGLAARRPHCHAAVAMRLEVKMAYRFGSRTSPSHATRYAPSGNVRHTSVLSEQLTRKLVSYWPQSGRTNDENLFCKTQQDPTGTNALQLCQSRLERPIGHRDAAKVSAQHS